MINAQINDLSSHNTKYTSPALTQKVFANMRRVGKGFSKVNTLLFDGMLVPQQVQDDVADAAEDEDVANEISAEPTPPSPTPATTLPPQQELIPSPSKTCATLTKKVGDLEQDKIAQAIEITKLKQRVRREVARVQAQFYHLDLEHAQKVLSMQETDEAEPAEVEEVLEVVTTAKLMTEVVTTATTPITDAPVPKASAPRRRRGVIIQVSEEAATALLSVKSKTHLQIIPNDEDDVDTEATPLALKVPVVDYQIHTEHNKPYYKIIRADRTHQLFLSFISLLKNFDREDLEMLWKIVQERFESSDPKNFSDDFLLNALKTMFEKPNVEANIWKNQRGRYGLAKVKSWKLLESYGVHIITFTTT
nr:hypothetical protein [Tanacetum cinerariifolium]